MDATHTKSRSNPLSPLEVLRERAKLLRKSVYAVDDGMKSELPEKIADDSLEHEQVYCSKLTDFISANQAIAAYPKVKEKLNLLNETVEDTYGHYTLSKDEDARTGHKPEDSSFFGYKTHIAMTEERIITAAVVTSGEKGDGPQLSQMIEQSQYNGMDIDTVIGDGAYFGKNNLELSEGRNIKLVANLNSIISQGARKEHDRFEYNKDAAMFVCPAGYMAVRKSKQGKRMLETIKRLLIILILKNVRFCLKRRLLQTGS